MKNADGDNSNDDGDSEEESAASPLDESVLQGV